MDRSDDQALTQLLRQNQPSPLDPQTTQRIYDDAWEAIRAGMAGEHDTSSTTATFRATTRRHQVIAAADARARRRRRLARTSAITTAVLLAGAGVAAAGTFVATRTGQHTTGWEVQTGGPGEALNLGGDDRVQVLTDLITDIPFAPGYEHLRDAELTTGNLRDQDPTGEQTYATSESAARGQVARDAICTWADAWLAADASADFSARDAATTALAGSLQWPAVSELDPDPSPTGYVGDSGAGSPTLFGTVPGIIAAAQSGQRQQVLDAVAVDAWCLPDYIPATLADPAYPGPRFDGPRG